MRLPEKVLDTARPIAVRLLSQIGQFPARQTDARDVVSLLRGLYPMMADKSLIRLGPIADGGYLVPDDLDGIKACFSPGVHWISGFEKDCADRGMEVFMADKTVEGPAEAHDSFHFVQKHLGATNDDETLTMDRWVGESLPGSDGDLLLQIDIEGSEYEVFLNTSDELMERFRIIVAEFHGLEMLFSRPFFSIAASVFRKILKTHVCVHIHPNNSSDSVTVKGVEVPRFAEFSFVRRDRIASNSYAASFPHPLDSDNTANAHLRLPTSMYNSQG